MNNKKFTLIELIVVIAVLGILASLIIPNISSFKGDAIITAIHSNVRNFQTSVDMYSLKNNGLYPTTNQPTEFIPQPIDFTKLDKTYLKTLPKTDNAKYWVDFQGRVWASTVDAPIGITVDNTTNNITWIPVTGAVKYQIFELQGYQGVIGTLIPNETNLLLKTETTTTNYIGEANKYYVINAVDRQNFQSAPAGVGYTGHAINHKPVAVITMTPDNNITTTTSITWGHNSTDEDGDTVSIAEWTLNGSVVTSLPTTFTEGTHTVGLKVKDIKGTESDITIKQFTVTQASQLGQLQLGQYVRYGRYNNNNITWRVVKKDENNVMLFLSDCFIRRPDGQVYNMRFDGSPATGEPKDSGRTSYGSNNWEYSEIRNWLNNSFYNNAFINKTYIKETTHDYILTTIDSAQATSGTTGHIYDKSVSTSLQNYNTTAYKKTITDKIYLVSIKELVENINPVMGISYSGQPYWLRDSHSGSSYHARMVNIYNEVYTEGVNNDYNVLVRPALNLKSAIFKSGDGTSSNPYVIE